MMIKKLINIGICIITIFAFTACNNTEIEATKTPFPELSGTDMEGNEITSEIFTEYDATVVNFWNNGCGTCIEEMPDLEEYYQEFKEENINFIGVGTDSCDSEEHLSMAKRLIEEKGVTYTNVVPNNESEFYTNFLSDIMSYPVTYVVDSNGDIIGTPIYGVVKFQNDTLRERLAIAKDSNS